MGLVRIRLRSNEAKDDLHRLRLAPTETCTKGNLLGISNFLGVSGRLVGPAAFKAVESSFTRRLVGSIPIHSRCI